MRQAIDRENALRLFLASRARPEKPHWTDRADREISSDAAGARHGSTWREL